MADHEGNIQLLKYPGGWQPWCLCGWAGGSFPNQGLARAQLANHVKTAGLTEDEKVALRAAEIRANLLRNMRRKETHDP